MSALEDLPKASSAFSSAAASAQLASDIAEAVAEAIAEEAEEARKKRNAKNMGFNAFVQHCKDTIPEIATASRVSEQRRLAKEMKENDRVAYKNFITKWNTAQAIVI